MEAAEIEKLVSDLELGVDRLRSLYEQYFMGIEKLEPTVPRKDVDRRIHVLRKEQIRNTAQRFRFQMILQRYNTYQTHWQRICREIENGTYKRHVQRAQRKFGDAPARPPQKSLLDGYEADPASEAPQGAYTLSADAAAELAELDREFGAGDEDTARAPLMPGPPPAAPARVAVRPAPASRSSVHDLDDADLLGEAPTELAPRPVAPPPRPPAPGPPRPPPPPRGPTPLPTQARPVPPPIAKAALPAQATAPKPPPPPRQPTPAPAPPRPAPVARPVPAVHAAPAPAPAPAPARPPAAASSRPDLSDDRVRQIYAQYVETKRKQNESTAAITYDGVARSLRESSAKLREKHGKAIDFEVTVKDGKTVLKPVVK